MGIIDASREGNLARVRQLIASGVNVNSQAEWNNTVLMIASHYGHVDIVRELISSGAEIDAGNYFGKTALMIASQHGHADIVPSNADVKNGVLNIWYNLTCSVCAIKKLRTLLSEEFLTLALHGKRVNITWCEC